MDLFCSLCIHWPPRWFIYRKWAISSGPNVLGLLTLKLLSSRTWLTLLSGSCSCSSFFQEISPSSQLWVANLPGSTCEGFSLLQERSHHHRPEFWFWFLQSPVSPPSSFIDETILHCSFTSSSNGFQVVSTRLICRFQQYSGFWSMFQSSSVCFCSQWATLQCFNVDSLGHWASLIGLTWFPCHQLVLIVLC